MDPRRSSSDPRLRHPAVGAADLRLPRRALFGALRHRRHRARRQDAGGAFAAAAVAAVDGLGLARPCSPAIVVSVAFALVHGFASITQRGNQIVSGVAINMLAAGLTAVPRQCLVRRGRAHAAAAERRALHADRSCRARRRSATCRSSARSMATSSPAITCSSIWPSWRAADRLGASTARASACGCGPSAKTRRGRHRRHLGAGCAIAP